ncbi:ribonuclease H family protein [Nocardia paucivorans]|uniref:ribonuclease H family protein n=1 Tax=Nocardia paucivorans TaxID=114259 RepID=UPI000593ED45|nr:ribonuclease H [Nocardia paucivorans]
MIIVSTDGSCLRNPGGAIGWAWVDHTGGADSGGAASGTNQIAELRALLEAIRAHPGPEPLLIESDSLYAIKCASEWIAGWRNNGWRTSNGAPVKNAELIQQIDRAIATRPGPVRFRWVRGHVGNYYNEQADALAGAAARRAAAGDSGSTTKIATVKGLTPEDDTTRTARRSDKNPVIIDTVVAPKDPAASGKAAEKAAARAATPATTEQALTLF